jgi:WD40 repeat protein
MTDGAIIGELKGHTGPVISVAFNPTGTLLATTDEDGTIGLWGVPR